jgi:hypothetical protein
MTFGQMVRMELWINGEIIISKIVRYTDRNACIKSFKERYNYALVRNDWEIFMFIESSINQEKDRKLLAA